MNMKKLFLCDIDGTIIDASRGMMSVSEKTKYALKKLSEDNYVFIASGRCKGLLEKQFLDLNTNGLMLCNGAYAEIDGKQIYAESFKQEHIDLIARVALENNGFYVFEGLNKMYVNDLRAPSFINFLNGWGPSLKNFEDYQEDIDKIHIAMIGFCNETDCDNAYKQLKDYLPISRHHNFMSYDINIPGINKGYGAKRLMEYLNIDKENSYCIGDAINDIEMLQAVGHPVIVANADKSLLKYNFERTLDVLEDGLYQYLVDNKLIKGL